MSCPRLDEIDAYLDGELDLSTTLAFERHLNEGGCAECARALAAAEALRESIGRAGLRFTPSPAQTRRLRRSLAGKIAETTSGSRAARFPTFPTRSWLPALAALLLVAVGSWSLGRFGARPAPAIGDEVVTGHVRSLLAGHLADVASTDRHTVKPWFTGRLDYAPVVVDFAAEGFPLVGGRLDYLGHHPVAALVYRSDRHVVNLFTWPSAYTADAAGTNPRTQSRQGFHLVHWTKDGMSYWAVSDVAEDRLLQLARLLKATPPG